MINSFLTRERCGTCNGNIICATEPAQGLLAYVRTWSCMMCSRELRPAELYDVRGRKIASQHVKVKMPLNETVWA